MAFEAALAALLSGLSEGSAHLLLTGPAGAGKSTLLRRLRAAVAESPALAARWWILALPDGLPGTTRASELGEQALAALADALDAEGAPAQARAIRAELASLPPEPEARLAVALDTMAGWARLDGRGIVLIVDPLDRLLSRFLDGPEALAPLLRDPVRLRIVGAARTLVEASRFQAVPLGVLSSAEQRELLTNLAAASGLEEQLKAVLADTGALAALQTWVGDGARGWVQLFEAVAMGGWGPIDDVLGRWLDRSSEALDLRMDSLAPQAQRVVVGLAEHGDPMPASRLALAIRLDVNAVSSQLSRLSRLGLVEGVTLPGTGRSGFQLTDRRLAAWLRMRLGGRPWQAEAALARFLALFHGDSEDSEDPGAARLQRAGMRARRGAWEDAILDLRLGLSGVEAWRPRGLALVLDAARALCQGGQGSAVLTALEAAELTEPWRPLAEALAVVGGASDRLTALSPELRGAVESVLAVLAPAAMGAEASATARRPGRGRRPRGRWGG